MCADRVHEPRRRRPLGSSVERSAGVLARLVRGQAGRWRRAAAATPEGKAAVERLRSGDLRSLDADAGAGAGEGVAGLLRGLLVDPLEDGLGSGLDQLLGLLEAEAGEGALLLDHVDLLLARGLEDDVELVLLLHGLGLTGAAGSGRGGSGDRGSGGHAEGVFELLYELAELEEGHLLESVEQLVGAELPNVGGSFRLGDPQVRVEVGFGDGPQALRPRGCRLLLPSLRPALLSRSQCPSLSRSPCPWLRRSRCPSLCPSRCPSLCRSLC